MKMSKYIQSALRVCSIAVAVFLVGCGDHDPQSTMNAAGPAAREISHLSWFVYIMFLIVAIVMWILILLVVTRPRGSLQEHAPVGSGGGMS